MMRRKMYREQDNRFIQLKSKILTYSDKIPNIENASHNYISYTNNSWFKTRHHLIDDYSYGSILLSDFNLTNQETDIPTDKTMQIYMHLNTIQQNIFEKWFYSFGSMHNATIIFLRKHLPYGSIKEYKKLYYINKKYQSINKNISDTKHNINKLFKKLNIMITKLHGLQSLIKKTKKQVQQIKTFNENIMVHKQNIKNMHIKLQNLYVDAKNYKPHIKSYEALNLHVRKMINYQYVRSNYMKDTKEFLKNNYSLGIENDPSTTIPSHSLDAAIKLACSSYKTAIQNFLSDRIKRFRIRCRNLNGPNKLMEVESNCFHKDGDFYHLKKDILGEISYTYNGESYMISENRTSTIHFDGKTYRLLMPVKIDTTQYTTKETYMGLDSGIRVFQTGITNDKMVKYGTNGYGIISKYLKKIDKLMNTNTLGSEIIKCENILNSKKKRLEKLQKKLLKSKEENKQYIKQSIEKLLKCIVKYEKQKIDLQNNINNKKETNTIETEIEQCKKTMENHREQLNKIVQKMTNLFIRNKEEYLSLIIKLDRWIKFNEQRILRLENINKNPKKKEKYEKYMKYRKINKANKYYDIINRKVKEMHWKIAHELATNYEIIVIGKLSIKSIVQQEDMNEMVKRVGQLMNHYKFRERLVYKALSYGRKIIVQEESYTTKTCPFCNHYNEWITNEKIIGCEKCYKIYDRDCGGALNITLKALN